MYLVTVARFTTPACGQRDGPVQRIQHIRASDQLVSPDHNLRHHAGYD